MTSAERIQSAVDKLNGASPSQLVITRSRGARAVFNKRIVKHDKCIKSVTELDFGAAPDYRRKVCDVLRQWAKTDEFVTLMSEDLPVHLGLPVRTYPDDCSLFQVVLLGPNVEFIILTLYEGDSVDTSPEPRVLEDFTIRCAHMLTFLLRNYCRKDFILLPCTLKKGDFFKGADSLEREVRNQQNRVANFYGGPKTLREETYKELLKGLLIIAAASEVPYYLDGSKDAGKKILMGDLDHDKVLRLFISHLRGKPSTDEPPLTVKYTERTKAVKTVLLEALRRLSFRQKVVIISDDEKVQDCVKNLADWSWCLSIEKAVSILRDNPGDRFLAAVTSDVRSSKTMIFEEKALERPRGESPLRVVLGGTRCSELINEAKSPEHTAGDKTSDRKLSSDVAQYETMPFQSTSREIQSTVFAGPQSDEFTRYFAAVSDEPDPIQATMDASTQRNEINSERQPMNNGLYEATIEGAEPRPSINDWHEAATVSVETGDTVSHKAAPTRTDADQTSSTDIRLGDTTPSGSFPHAGAAHADTMERAGQREPKSADTCLVVIDGPHFPSCCIRLTQDDPSKQFSREDEILRFLLVGKSGSGKSSTANTLLGEEKRFASGVSFSPVTTSAQTAVGKYEDKTIEVVESPGIFSFTGGFTNACSPYSKASTINSTEDFDVVCFVLKIGPFTEEERQAFDRIKIMFGEAVVHRMVVIFTGGDNIPGEENILSLIAKAPLSFRDMMGQCGQRYVVFDNSRPWDKDQVKELFRQLCKVKSGEKFHCPSYTDLRRRWERAMFLDREKKKRTLYSG